MSHGTWRRGVVFFTILTTITLLVALLWPTNNKSTSDGANNTIILVNPSGGCNKSAVARELLLRQGFKANEFVIGEDKIDWSQSEASEHGNGSFTTPKKTAVEYTNWLKSDEKSAQSVRNNTEVQGQASPQQVVNPENWVGFQLKIKSDWEGNKLNRNGSIKSAGTRHSDAGDAGWIFVHPADCRRQETTSTTAGNQTVVRTVVVRLGCGNPQTKPPIPARPVNPTPPPTGEQGKDHRLSPPTTVVVYCPPGQYLDRYTETCINPPATTTTTDGGQGDSGDGATNTTTPPSTTAPPPAPPTTSPPTTPPPPPTIPSL